VLLECRIEEPPDWVKSVTPYVARWNPPCSSHRLALQNPRTAEQAGAYAAHAAGLRQARSRDRQADVVGLVPRDAGGVAAVGP